MNESTAPAGGSGIPFPKVPKVIFTHWREALRQAGLSPAVQTIYAMAISGYTA